MIAKFLCLLRQNHNAVRHPLGGFKCSDCGTVGIDLDEMGFHGTGYVLPIRKLFSRDKSNFTRLNW
jgi:hypothetical protein